MDNNGQFIISAHCSYDDVCRFKCLSFKVGWVLTGCYGVVILAKLLRNFVNKKQSIVYC